jgi:hypothetical protein
MCRATNGLQRSTFFDSTVNKCGTTLQFTCFLKYCFLDLLVFYTYATSECIHNSIVLALDTFVTALTFALTGQLLVCRAFYHFYFIAITSHY